MKTEYPELKDIPEFSTLQNKEMLFVWHYANPTSPFASIKSPRERAKLAIEKSFGTSLPKQLRDELLSGQMSAKFRDACEKMASFMPDLRARAKSMVEGIFSRYEKILMVSEEQFEIVNDAQGKNKAEFVDISGKISKTLPDLVQQIENGYGVKGSVKGSGDSVGNIMDDIRIN